tara:strand:- start:884 stop:1525 length:642 start_codon:yes stop_codon:yes gene_type:complete
VSDYLTEEEQVARIKRWWAENGKYVAVAIVLGIAGVFANNWYESYTEDRNIAASDLYERFLNASSVERSEVYDQLAGSASGSGYHFLALMHLAKTAVIESDYEQARNHLTEAVEKAPSQVLADLSRLRLAKVLMEVEEIENAIEVLRDIKSTGFSSAASELRGDIHLASGEEGLANEAYISALKASGTNAARPVLQMKVVDTTKVLDGQVIAD